MLFSEQRPWLEWAPFDVAVLLRQSDCDSPPVEGQEKQDEYKPDTGEKEMSRKHLSKEKRIY